MGLIIIYSLIAKRDLTDIYSFIRRNSFHYAQKEVKEIRVAIKSLKQNSFLGKKFEKANSEITRELIFKNYRIIYDIVSDKKIIILTIHHHARNLTNNPAVNPED